MLKNILKDIGYVCLIRLDIKKTFWGGGVLKQILEVSYSFLQRQYEGEKLIEKMQKKGGG